MIGKSFAMIGFLSLLIGSLSFSASSGSGGYILEVGESMGAGGPPNESMGQGMMEQNQTHEQNRTRERNETGEGEQVRAQVENQGISQQVQEIIRNRKNGSISVPQGMMVRIVARNHTMSVENASFMLNESLQVRIMLQGRNRSLDVEPLKAGLRLREGNASVTTNETLEVAGEQLRARGKTLSVLPSQIRDRIRAMSITNATLGIEGDAPVYRFTARKEYRLLWLFQLHADVPMALDASSGQVKEQQGPWWAFMASEAQ